MAEMDPIRYLIEQAYCGDGAAFDALMESYKGRLRANIDSNIKSHTYASLDPDEILQETFVRAFQSLNRFEWQGKDSFYLWLCGIARNVVHKVDKKARRSKRLDSQGQIAGNGTSPSRFLQRKERFDRLEKAFAKLSPECREVLRLSRLKGHRLKDIALQLNRSEYAVRQVLAKAVLEFRNIFGDTESFHLPDNACHLEGEDNGRE